MSQHSKLLILHCPKSTTLIHSISTILHHNRSICSHYKNLHYKRFTSSHCREILYARHAKIPGTFVSSVMQKKHSMIKTSNTSGKIIHIYS